MADVIWFVLGNAKIRLSNRELLFAETVLGWIVEGAPFPQKESQRIISCNVNIKDENQALENILQRLSSQGEITTNIRNMSKEDLECENQFLNAVLRNPTDRRFIS